MNTRLVLLLPLVAGIVACSSGDSGGGDGNPNPNPIDGGNGQAPVNLDFTSDPLNDEDNPVEDKPWEYQITTNTDLDQYLTYTLVNGPSGMAVSESGVVTWTAGDEHGDLVNVTISVVYNDGTNTASAQQTFRLPVTHVNDKPEIVSEVPKIDSIVGRDTL